MLKRGLFKVNALVDGVEISEDYELPYRTEEWIAGIHTTLYQAAQFRLAEDLGKLKHLTIKQKKRQYEFYMKFGIELYGIRILDISEIHNNLIIEEHKCD